MRLEDQTRIRLHQGGTPFSYVITVCDETSAERCPIFPFGIKRLHWSFEDPSSFQGTWEERLEATIRVRDEIKTRLVEWCESVCVAGNAN